MGSITGYVVKFYNGTEYKAEEVEGELSTSYTAYNLQPNTRRRYGLSVAAVNTFGCGDFSPPVWVNTPPKIFGILEFN